MIYENKPQKKKRAITIRSEYGLFNDLDFIAKFRSEAISETMRYLLKHSIQQHFYHMEQLGVKKKGELTLLRPMSEKQII